MSAEDGIETIIGKFGRYQTYILILITLGRYPTEFQLCNVVFILPSVEYTCLDEEALNATNYCPCQYPDYDQSTIVNSVTSEWNLICDRTPLASLAQSMLQAGILIGSLIFGYISDRYGRKKAVSIALTSQVFLVALSSVVTEFWMFLVCRFMIGIAVGGTMLCCFILLIELSGKSFRPYIAALAEMAFVTGYITLPIVAYFIRKWRFLQLATSVPWVFVLSYFWLLPESPRWLISVGKKEEAVKILRYIASKNKRRMENIEAILEEIENEKPGSFIDLFKTPKIRTYTIIMALIWLCCAHAYFGINQYIGRLPGNIYLNVFLSALLVAPGLILVVIAALNFKRKLSVLITFTTTAVSLLVIIFIPDDIPAATLVFAIVGQLGAFTSFILIYLYACEVFPTVIRNSAMGFASVFARLGGFIAPFVVNIGIEWVSLLMFGGVALCAAFLCIFLPETKDIVLLNTIRETEMTQRNFERENATL